MKTLAICRGYTLAVVANATSSRHAPDRELALEHMRQIGAFVRSTESAILALVGGAEHPAFKQIQSIIKVASPDTGLHSRESDTPGLLPKL